MPVLVDTNVITDVLFSDPLWEEWSKLQMAGHTGDLLVNPLIYAELCYKAASPDQVDQMLSLLGLGFVEMPRQALYLAAQAYRSYRQRGGVKTSALPDFFIGAHAEAEGLTLLTRDVNRYKTYFPSVSLIHP